jgi:Zn-dependent protease with chaperone function
VAFAVCVVMVAVAAFGAVAPRIGFGHVHAQARLIEKTPAQSAPPAYTLPPDKLAKATALGWIRSILYFGDAVWGIAVLWLLLATRAAARLEAWTERISGQRWMQGLIFFAALIVILTVTELPVGVYAHRVSLSYGISVQGWWSWLADVGKSLGLSLLIGAPVLLLFNWIVRAAPRRYWLWGWMAAVVLTVLGTFVEPLGEPIFNEYEPLEKTNPALVAELEKVVARTGTEIPPSRMFLMKASEKTNGLNAYVSGLGATKRVVVWDTTAGRIPNDEAMFIFGHESGHYVLHHIPQILAGGAVFLFFVFWACAGIAGGVARRFGGRWGLERTEFGSRMVAPLATRAGFVVLLLTIAIANFVLDPVSNAFSRHFEHEADVYGQEAIHGLVADPQKTAVGSLDHLGAAWLDDPEPNGFVVWWMYSHPSIQQRAQFAAGYDPWKDGGRGRFFAQ